MSSRPHNSFPGPIRAPLLRVNGQSLREIKKYLLKNPQYFKFGTVYISSAHSMPPCLLSTK